MLRRIESHLRGWGTMEKIVETQGKGRKVPWKDTGSGRHALNTEMKKRRWCRGSLLSLISVFWGVSLFVCCVELVHACRNTGSALFVANLLNVCATFAAPRRSVGLVWLLRT